MTAATVTKLRCQGCGADLVQPSTGRPRRTCSNACRQKAHRQRWTPMSPGERRRLLKIAINRAVRERIAAHDRAAGVALLKEWRRAA